MGCVEVSALFKFMKIVGGILCVWVDGSNDQWDMHHFFETFTAIEAFLLVFIVFILLCINILGFHSGNSWTSALNVRFCIMPRTCASCLYVWLFLGRIRGGNKLMKYLPWCLFDCCRTRLRRVMKFLWHLWNDVLQNGETSSFSAVKKISESDWRWIK